MSDSVLPSFPCPTQIHLVPWHSSIIVLISSVQLASKSTLSVHSVDSTPLRWTFAWSGRSGVPCGVHCLQSFLINDSHCLTAVTCADLSFALGCCLKLCSAFQCFAKENIWMSEFNPETGIIHWRFAVFILSWTLLETPLTGCGPNTHFECNILQLHLAVTLIPTNRTGAEIEGFIKLVSTYSFLSLSLSLYLPFSPTLLSTQDRKYIRISPQCFLTAEAFVCFFLSLFFFLFFFYFFFFKDSSHIRNPAAL